MVEDNEPGISSDELLDYISLKLELEMTCLSVNHCTQ